MEVPFTPNHLLGPSTTASSAAEGRLKVDAAGMKRKKKVILKKVVNSNVQR